MKTSLTKWFIISIFSLLFISIFYKVTNFNNLLYISLSEQFTTRQIEQYFRLHNKWQWISYIILPIYIFIKVTLTSTLLYIGTFFFSKSSISFKQLWGSAINAEFIFLFVPFLKIIWFSFFQTKYYLEDVQFFYPFSALNIINYKGLDPWLIYPLQTLNVFELTYIIILSYQLGTLTNTNADNGLKIVASSYLPALLLWVTVVMFFTLNFS